MNNSKASNTSNIVKLTQTKKYIYRFDFTFWAKFSLINSRKDNFLDLTGFNSLKVFILSEHNNIRYSNKRFIGDEFMG